MATNSNLLIRTMLATLLMISAVGAQSPKPDDPNAKNYRKWLEFIRPNESELSYETIGWRNELWPAVLEARKLGRPILLWTMNGHPLGCT